VTKTTLQSTPQGEILEYMDPESSYFIQYEGKWLVVFGGTKHGVYSTESEAFAAIHAIMAITRRERPSSC